MICKHKGCNNETGTRPVNNPNKTNKEYTATYTECYKCRHLRSKYNITAPERNQLIKEQDGCCAICTTPVELDGKATKQSAVVDHDHITGKIRGILCGQCNKGLGIFGDTLEGLNKAVKYLESNK
jgi:hypothetical protein